MALLGRRIFQVLTFASPPPFFRRFLMALIIPFWESPFHHDDGPHADNILVLKKFSVFDFRQSKGFPFYKTEGFSP